MVSPKQKKTRAKTRNDQKSARKPDTGVTQLSIRNAESTVGVSIILVYKFFFMTKCSLNHTSSIYAIRKKLRKKAEFCSLVP